MTLSLGSLVNDGMDHIDAAPADYERAGALGNLAYAAIRPLRYRMLYHRVVGDLEWLDDDVLRDIGLPRWDIGTYAHSRAESRWPARQSLRAILAGAATAVWRAVRRGAERRKTIRDLMMLDDWTLKDIGLSRSQIPWVANEIVRRPHQVDLITTRCSPPPDMARVDERTCPSKRPSQELLPSHATPCVATPANDGRMLKAS